MKILITGITGQDGSYLAEQLLAQGHKVHGIIRRSSSFNTQRIEHIYNKLSLHYGDITDPQSISNIIQRLQPDEIYNLAAQSFVKASFEIPYYTAQVDAVGVLNILEAIKEHSPHTRLLQATTSELYGKVAEIPQTEKTSFNPQSPYGIAKLYAYHITRNYRDAYGLFVSNSICFNHESPRRGHTFVTKKIVHALVNRNPVVLGNIDAKRDWGYAPEYTQAMQMILRHHTPDDFVIATGETHTVRDFIKECCNVLDISLQWKDEGVNEVGISNGKTLVSIDKRYFRPTEVDLLLGSAAKAREVLGWQPKVKFKELVKIMIENENQL